MSGLSTVTPRGRTFRHEALLYAGQAQFLDGVLPFIREGLAEGQAQLVATDRAKIELVRGALGEASNHVEFADMAELGANPARIIPAWREFADRNGRRPLRGIGEPIWAGRSAAELIECQRHESLLNLAFADTPDFTLLCPYDTDALGTAVIDEAHRSHPFVCERGVTRDSPTCLPLDALAAPFDAPLPDAPPDADEFEFGPETLRDLRDYVRARAQIAGLADAQSSDLVLAVHELTSNSVHHGGGKGTLRIWREADSLVCEVRDGGRIDQPLAGRELPATDQVGGFGLWIVNQLCDLVQVRSFASGSVVRVFLRSH